MTRIVVIGNEKGGSGKSTVAMHLIVALLARGSRVASLDLDARQATLTRYVENRRRDPSLSIPEHRALHPGADAAGDARALAEAVAELAARADYLVIDTPGSDQPLSRLAHARADTLVTPLNDSLIDLDPLARVDPATRRIGRPGPYAEMVWEARKHRARGGRRATDWFVLRNRLSPLDARNKREMERLLRELAARIGFRLAPGLSERVIYRELFLEGLTLLDLGGARGMTLSQVAARQELRRLVEGIELGEAQPASLANSSA